MPHRTLSREDRFWLKVRKGDLCWNWMAYLNRHGYGEFRAVRRTGKVGAVPAHRFAYELLVGQVPEGLELDHLCRNRRCVNPAHLEAVTHAENLRRGNWSPVLNAKKTHCKHGHEFTPENTYWRKDRPGQRHCRRCKLERDRRVRAETPHARSST